MTHRVRTMSRAFVAAIALTLSTFVLVPSPAHALSTPQNVRITATNYTAVNVQWNKVSGAKRYKVTWRASDAKTAKTQWVTGTKLKLTKLDPGTAHVVGITAQDKKKKNSKRSPLLTFYTKGDASPESGTVSPESNTATPTTLAMPKNLTVDATTSNSASFSWDPVPGATGYRITWRPADESTARIYTLDKTSETLTGLKPNRDHVYGVRAVADDKTSSSRTPLSTARTAAAPGTEANVSAPADMINASNTGVPSGVSLTKHTGVLRITKAGTVIDGLDIAGTLEVRASNVTIRNSRIRGQKPTNIGLVNVHSDATGLLIQDTEIYSDDRNPDSNGIMGSNFTLERVEIRDVVDQVHIHGAGNVTIRHSWLHSNTHFKNDPNWGGTPSHDDNIQIVNGDRITIENSRIEGAVNTAIMIGQDRGKITNLTIRDNVIGGGACSINISPKSYGNMTSLRVESNTFERNQTKHLGCAVLAPEGSVPTMLNNIWADTGAIVQHNRG